LEKRRKEKGTRRANEWDKKGCSYTLVGKMGKSKPKSPGERDDCLTGGGGGSGKGPTSNERGKLEWEQNALQNPKEQKPNVKSKKK